MFSDVCFDFVGELDTYSKPIPFTLLSTQSREAWSGNLPDYKEAN